MAGKNCVAIASDKRFGIQFSTVSMEFPKVFEMGPHLFLGLAGLATDVQTVYVDRSWPTLVLIEKAAY